MARVLSVYAFSNVDNARIAQAAVTIVKAGNITFSGISPSIAPQGGLQQDIFLAATNATSQIGVTLSGPNGNVTLDPSQIKVIFAAGTTTASIGARVRLNSTQLATAGPYTVQVTTSNTSISVTGGPLSLNIVPLPPTIVSSTPDNFQESALGLTRGVPFVIDGGFFGPAASPTVTPQVNGHSLLANTQLVSTARRIGGSLPSPIGSTANAGLFPVSVKYSISPMPPPGPTATTSFTNFPIIPDSRGTHPPRTPPPFAP